MYNVTPENIASVVFEAYHKDVVSDDFKNYEPGDSDHFLLTHRETKRTFKVQVVEVTRIK